MTALVAVAEMMIAGAETGVMTEGTIDGPAARAARM